MAVVLPRPQAAKGYILGHMKPNVVLKLKCERLYRLNADPKQLSFVE